MRLRIDLAYDGTEFNGWATQPGLRTVQGSLEEALATRCGAAARVTCAGRPTPACTPAVRSPTST